MTAPGNDSSAPLAAEEGVNEGSAASSQATAGARPAPATGASHATDPATDPESAPAPPDDMESSESRAARDAAGTGQQLQAGEG